MINVVKSVGVAALICCGVLTSVALAQNKPSGTLIADADAQSIRGGCAHMVPATCEGGSDCGGQIALTEAMYGGDICSRGELIGCDGVTGGACCDCYDINVTVMCLIEAGLDGL